MMDAGKIGKVAAVAKSTEQKSAYALKVGQQGHQQKRDQLDQLVQFKQEYEAKLGTVGEQGIAARQLQDYRLFLSKLNQAIDQQVRDVQVSEEGLSATKEQWLEESRRKSALDHLLEQHHKNQLQAREKTEQKIADEDTLVRSTMINKP